MKIISQPSVWLLSAPQFFDHPTYTIPEGGTPSERLIAHAGKGCYDSYGADGRPLVEHIRGLIGSHHGSVLEHANISMWLEGISRGCSHELVRHRAGFSFSQRSTRYARENDAAMVLAPALATIYEKDEASRTEREVRVLGRAIASFEAALATYGEQVEDFGELAPDALGGTERRKWARGNARQGLHHALETRMTMTGNLRAWRHFLEQRSSRFAEAEIRRLTASIVAVLAPLAPMVFADYDMVHRDGYPEYYTANGKV